MATPSRKKAIPSCSRTTSRLFRSSFWSSVPPLLLLLLLWASPTQQKTIEEEGCVKVVAEPVDKDKLKVNWDLNTTVCGNVTSCTLSWMSDGDGVNGDETIDDCSNNNNTIIDGLTPCISYSITLQPYNDDVALGKPGSASATMDLLECVSVSARPDDSTILNVSWILNANVDVSVISYNLSWWSDEGEGYDSVKIDDGSTTTYNINELTPCTNYNINLQPYDDNEPLGMPGQTTAEAGSQVVTPVSSVSVTEVPENSQQLQVFWELAVDIGNCPGYYNVTWDGPEVSHEAEVQDITSYNITGLNPWTNYTVCVDSGLNNASVYNKPNCTDGTTSEDVPGDPPQPVSVTSTSDTITLQWEEPDKPNGIIVSYTVTWSPDDGTYTTTDGETYSYTILDLLPCTNYTISVIAATSKGSGPPGNTSESTTLVGPESPTNVAAYMMFNKSDNLYVNWTQAEAPGRCNIISNTITWRLSGSDTDLGTDTVDATEAYTISGLEPWTTYQVCVSATNQGGESPAPGCGTGTTDEDIPGSPPQSVSVTNTTSDTITLKWEEPDKPNGIIVSYTVTWSPDDGTNTTSDNKTNSYTIPDLLPCTDYTISVTATTSKGSGPPGNTSESTIPVAPPSPEWVICTNTESRSLNMAWGTPDTRCNVTRYLVQYKGDILWSNETVVGSSTSTMEFINLANLTPWTNYTACVRAEAVGILVGNSNCCMATTLQEAPNEPADLMKSGSDSSSISVTWNPPTEVNGQLSGYHLSWKHGSRNLSHLNHSAKISGLHAGTKYIIQLQAVTANQYVGEASEIKAWTDPSNVGAIVGGVVGGLLLILLILALVFRERIKEKVGRKDKNPMPSTRSSIRGGSTPRSPRPPIPPKPKPVSFEMSPQTNWEDGVVGKHEIRNYIQYLEEDAQRSLEEEFQKMKNLSPSHPTNAALTDYNKPKNRWVNILPFDHSRVKLPVASSQPGSDYINANYIMDDSGQHYFVATQGPKANTVADFWRMVWELRIYTIVMLTNIREKGKNKCEQYWPSRSDPPYTYESFTVSNQSEDDTNADYTVRLLVLCKGEQRRVVKQFHFTTWPDFDAPSEEGQLLALVKAVKETRQDVAKHLLVHCSAGVGRTGTFIGLWNLTEDISKDPGVPTVSVREAVLKMRECRPTMVQSQEQLLYLWKCVAAYLENPQKWASSVGSSEDHIYDNAAFSDPIYENL